MLTAPEPLFCDTFQGHCCEADHPCADLAFIDYNMPKMTGLEFIELMTRRGCNAEPATKILMTGDMGTVDRQAVAAIGCRLVQKPVSFRAVDEIVKEIQSKLSPERQLADLTAKIASSGEPATAG